MSDAAFSVDLRNPGQVFASLGTLEIARILEGHATGAFDWAGPEPIFRLHTSSEESPVARVLQFLETAQVATLAPAESWNPTKWKASWGTIPEIVPSDMPFPFPNPSTPATLPAVLRDDCGHEVPLDYWGDAPAATGRDNVKFWAGAGGYPGAAILRDAINLARRVKLRDHCSDPFALSAPQSNSFRFDWRRDYVPVDTGFSPNAHPKGTFSMEGFPLVEVLAAVGVTNARPSRTDRSNKLSYRYGVIGSLTAGELLDPILLRVALGGKSPSPGLPFRKFVMQLGWPGKEGQARCITHVIEEETENE